LIKSETEGLVLIKKDGCEGRTRDERTSRTNVFGTFTAGRPFHGPGGDNQKVKGEKEVVGDRYGKLVWNVRKEREGWIW